MAKQQKTIEAIQLRKFKIKIEGTSSLIMQKFNQEDLEKVKGGSKQKWTPEEEVNRFIHRTEKGEIGFPTMAFKWAVINACRQTETFKMTQIKPAFIILPENDEGLTIIKSDKVEMISQIKRIQKAAVLKHFPIFKNWKCELTIQYNENSIKQEELLYLFQLAGLSSGIGLDRPQLGGSNGMFKIVN
jgi:hypothetical protein